MSQLSPSTSIQLQRRGQLVLFLSLGLSSIGLFGLLGGVERFFLHQAESDFLAWPVSFFYFWPLCIPLGLYLVIARWTVEEVQGMMKTFRSARFLLGQLSSHQPASYLPSTIGSSARVQIRAFVSTRRIFQQQETIANSHHDTQTPPPPAISTPPTAVADHLDAAPKERKESPFERKRRLKREQELRRFDRLQRLQLSDASSRKSLKEKARASKLARKSQRRLDRESPKEWKEDIESEGQEQIAAAEETPAEGSVAPSNEASSISLPPTPYGTRSLRAALLARSVTSARSKQPRESADESAPARYLPDPLIAPGAGVSGPHAIRLNFDQTEIVYPPSDKYPPPLPVVYDADPIMAARALGVLKSCEVEWTSEGDAPHWRKTNLSNEDFENLQLQEYLDNEQGLEFIGDSALHLISRTLIINRYPGKTVAAYNLASSWLVSNDCFAYIYEDSGLAEERVRIARLMVQMSKKRELQRNEHLTEEERTQREAAPLPEPVLPTMMHLRQADLLEAYAGSVFLTYGFTTLSKWCTPLLEPWLEAIGRTSAFHQDHFLSPSGEITRKAQIQAEKDAAELKRKSLTWWGRLRSRFFAQG